ncbi:MAG: hypothetical protein NT175_08950 [Bacteroidetes bacterium]|nr:hypothetical protein [Bacteroidota bacterium]
MKKEMLKNTGFIPEVVKGSNEYIGFGIPTISIYIIQPSNIFPILNDDFSVNDSRPTFLQILDKHLDRYINVWQALS